MIGNMVSRRHLRRSRDAPLTGLRWTTIRTRMVTRTERKTLMMEEEIWGVISRRLGRGLCQDAADADTRISLLVVKHYIAPMNGRSL
jgi:hypothetical protein